MKKRRFLARVLFALAVITFTTLAAGQTSVPLQINYQGQLKSPTTGASVRDGSYDMVFEIFSDATRGVSLWRGQHTAANRNPVEIKDGRFNVILGSGAGNALDTSVFKSPYAWLQICIGLEILAPRQKITSVAYSMVSDNSRLLDGRSASDFVISGGVVEALKVTYPTPREHVLSMGPDHFAPSRGGLNCITGSSHTAGAYFIDSTQFTLSAPVNLPHGAVVTEFTAFFLDDSANYMIVDLRRRSRTGQLEYLAAVDSVAVSVFGADTDAEIENAVIDNVNYSYVIIVHAIDDWDLQRLQIIGAAITYTISEAL